MRHAGLLHQFVIACTDGMSVDFGTHAAAGQFFNIRYARCFKLLAIRLAQRARNRMVGIALRQRSKFQQTCFTYPVGMNRRYIENALCQRTGLIEHNDFRIGQHLKVVASLDKHATFRRAADPAEKAERHRDHKRARARDDQENQRAVNPFVPRITKRQRRHDGQQRSRDHDGRGVITRKPCNEVFGTGFFAARIFDKVQDFCDG